MVGAFAGHRIDAAIKKFVSFLCEALEIEIIFIGKNRMCLHPSQILSHLYSPFQIYLNRKIKNFEFETLNFELSFVTICLQMPDEIKLIEKSRIMDGARMERAMSRLASEIVEANQGAMDLYLVGIRRRGVPLAERLVDKIEALEGVRPLYGIIDITLYRDDLSTVGANPIVNRTELDTDIEGKIIVLVDDVLYTGRTIRAALDQLMDFGRPKKVQLAVLIDRGHEHRELPIQADFVGKVVPTKQAEIVKVMLKEYDDIEAVGIFERPSS